MVKVAGTINKSTEVMKIVNDLVQIGSMQSSMRDMARGVCTGQCVCVVSHVCGILLTLHAMISQLRFP